MINKLRGQWHEMFTIPDTNAVEKRENDTITPTPTTASAPTAVYTFPPHDLIIDTAEALHTHTIANLTLASPLQLAPEAYNVTLPVTQPNQVSYLTHTNTQVQPYCKLIIYVNLINMLIYVYRYWCSTYKYTTPTTSRYTSTCEARSATSV